MGRGKKSALRCRMAGDNERQARSAIKLPLAYLTGSESFSRHTWTGGGGSGAGGRLGGRRHVLMALIRLRGITTNAKPGNNLRDFSKLRPTGGIVWRMQEME